MKKKSNIIIVILIVSLTITCLMNNYNLQKLRKDLGHTYMNVSGVLNLNLRSIETTFSDLKAADDIDESIQNKLIDISYMLYGQEKIISTNIPFLDFEIYCSQLSKDIRDFAEEHETFSKEEYESNIKSITERLNKGIEITDYIIEKCKRNDKSDYKKWYKNFYRNEQFINEINKLLKE